VLLTWFLFLFGIAVIARDIKISDYRVLLNPFFWAVFCSILYLIIPAFFIFEINYYFNWGIEGDSVFYAQLLVFCFFIFLCSLYYFCPSYRLASREDKVEKRTSIFIKFLWFVIFAYTCFALYKSIQSGVLLNAFIYDFEQDDPYKLKNVAYILIPISIYMFASVRNYLVFLPNLIIISIDLMNGSRTIAFIVLIPFIITLCINQKRLYIVPGLILLIGMLVLGVLCLGSVTGDIPWYINALGEFRETYLTLPLYIGDETYIGVGNWDNRAAGFFQGILQPLRSYINEEYIYAGSYMAKDIGRGYGLGSNFLVAILYYGYEYLFVTIPLFGGILVLFYKLVSKLKMVEKLVFISLLIIFIRLIIREGLYTSLGMLCFICIFYWLPFHILSRLKFKKNSETQVYNSPWGRIFKEEP